MSPSKSPSVSPEQVREALLALEGSVLENFELPLPGDLKDISKAAAYVSGVVEDRFPAMLNSVRDRTWDADGELHAFEFRRYTIGFPDVLLVERTNEENVIFELEAKSWYVLSRDPLTARFETSSAAIRKGTLLAIAAWSLDGIVSGAPTILRIHVDDAQRLATSRDAAWVAAAPDTHRVVDPVNEPDTPRHLLKTQVRGEMKDGSGKWKKDSENFGKLERFRDAELKKFRDSVWSLSAGGKTYKQWHEFVK